MDHEQVRAVVKEAVKETFTSFGLPNDPQQMQKYMVYIAESYANNQNLKRDFRSAIIKNIFSFAFLVALWEGAKKLF